MGKKIFYIFILLIMIIIVGICFFSNNTDNKQPIHSIFKVNSYNKSKFNGKVYDENLNEYNITSLFDYGFATIKSSVINYYFTPNIKEEKEKLNVQNSKKTYNFDINYLCDLLGYPSTVYEKYKQGEDDKSSKSVGTVILIYNSDDYVIVVNLEDFRNQKGNIIFKGITIYDKNYFNKNALRLYDDFECYGEKLSAKESNENFLETQKIKSLNLTIPNGFIIENTNLNVDLKLKYDDKINYCEMHIYTRNSNDIDAYKELQNNKKELESLGSKADNITTKIINRNTWYIMSCTSDISTVYYATTDYNNTLYKLSFFIYSDNKEYCLNKYNEILNSIYFE